MSRKDYNVDWITGLDVKMAAKRGLLFCEEKELLSILREQDTIGLVVRDDSDVVGYLIYSVLKDVGYSIINVFTDPAHRRKGVATAMVDYLKSRIRRGRSVNAFVEETNPPALEFFKALKFCSTMARNSADGPDWISFQYKA